jgi:transcriptional regulator with XRE-family HTH domain
MDELLARKLRVLRAERGWTLNQAAERAGVQPETISDAEHGKRRPYTPTLTKIAKGYGVPVEDLLKEPIPLAEASQETGHLEEERLETDSPKDRQHWERVLASVRGRQREVEAKVEELVALPDQSKADLYQVKWALDEAQECVLTIMQGLPGADTQRSRERVKIVIDPLTIDVDQFAEFQQEYMKAERFYNDIVERLVEVGLVEMQERPGQPPKPVPAGIGA